jgi:hypothetical protein
MKAIRSAWETVKEFRRAYVVLNVVYYGLVIVGMIYVAFDPSLQQTLLGAASGAFTSGPLAAVGSAYSGGQVLRAVALTFVVNLIVGSIAFVTLPSLVIPFSGLLVGVYRAILWGLMLSPAAPELRLIMIPHSLTLILEGQAYILAMPGGLRARPGLPVAAERGGHEPQAGIWDRGQAFAAHVRAGRARVGRRGGLRGAGNHPIYQARGGAVRAWVSPSRFR